MEFWKKWVNIAVVFILTLSLLSPAIVSAENNTGATATEEVVEDLLSESNENTLHVFSLINAIPSIEQLNETNHLLVQEARAAYEKLTDEQKQNVTNIQALVEKENALQALSEKVVAPQTLNEVAEPEGYAYLSMEDFAERGDGAIFPEQLGTIIGREKVPFYEGDTIADVTVRALEGKGITPSYDGDTKGGFYLSSIQNFTHNGQLISSFGEFSAGNMSGWMVTLNDWFINMGASEFLVMEGDTITWQYTGDYGADIGSDWTNASAKFTGLNIVGNVGQLSPAFDTAVKSYTLTVPEDTKTIQLKAEANKSSRIQYYVGNVEYKMLTDIAVNGGTVITIKSTFEDTNSGKKDADEITVEVVFEQKEEIVPTDKTLLQTSIAEAEANKATAAVSADGKGIDPTEYWVSQTELDTYVGVIKTAQQLIADEAATQEAIDAKTLALNQAIVAFNEAKKAGLKTVLPENDVEFTVAPKALTLKLYDEDGQQVDIGEGTAGTYKVYTAKLTAGSYQYEGFGTDGKSIGGGQLTIIDEPQQKYQFHQLNFKATNKNWTAGSDYTVKVGQNSPTDTSLKFGELTSTGQVPVLALTNQTYFYHFEAHEKYKGYVPLSSSVTVTISTAAQTISGAIPLESNVTFTVPEAATLFVGTKVKHFISFQEVKPAAEVVNNNGTKTYSYTLANGSQYNYRVSQPGKLTNTGIFKATETTNLEITDEQLNAVSPKEILNKGTYLEGNIYLNINPQNHLSLHEAESFKLLPLRSWQALIEGVNNYFFEPDFHYEIITGNDVIAIEPGEPGSYTSIKAIKNGTAIVKVSYDALKVNGSTYIKDANDAFSAIWPENVGLFVVTVGQSDVNISTGIESNKERNLKANEKMAKNLQNGAFDADIDSVYFVEGERGAYYTFTPEENSTVSLLRPQLNKEQGAASYGDGTFTTDEVNKNEDGSFTVLLTDGRNIVKVEKDGEAAYQVMTARPIGVTIENVTSPGEKIVAGNSVKVKVDGISFPANKLSGIYNFSGQLTFTDSKNKVLSGKAVQYNLITLGNEITFTVPEGHVGEFVLKDGHIAIKGFGSAIGAHRDIDPLIGANPNFAALTMESYYSIFPQIAIISDETNKEPLQTKITDAEANKATAAVSADGKDIDPTEYWVTQTELDTYVGVIKTAQQLITDEAATQEAIDAKTLALNQAIVAFNEAKKAGSKSAEQLTTQLGYNTAAEYLVNILPTPTFGSEWVIFALARGGYEVPAGYYETYYKNVVDYVQSVNGELHARKYTEYSRLVLALTAIGKDPRNVGGYNIVEKLYDFDKVVWQGVNGAYFGLIALDTWGFELPEDVANTRQKLIDHILQKQLNDGGFALSGTKADPDMTGMAIQALAPYQSQETVAAATNRAVTILATIQKENGGYASWGTESAESAAQVITALASIGIDVTKDARFNKVLPNMMSFYSPTDGGFKHTHPETKANGMATEQVGYTLAAYKRLLSGQTKLYDMSDVKPSVEDDGDEEEPITPPTEEKEPPKEGLAYGQTDFSIVISSSEVPLSTTEIEIFEGDSVFDALKRATSLYGIPLSYRSSSYGIYIDGINGLYEFDRGPLSGWMYRVNGVFPAFSAALYTLQPGDQVEWLYTTDLGRDVGGYIEDIEKDPNEEKTDKDKQENEAKTTVVTVGEAAEHLEAELTAETIEKHLQDGVKKIVIQDKKGTKVELPIAALKLVEGEKAVVAVNKQADGNVIDVTLAITSKNGSKKSLVTGKDYAKVTISAPTASATTVVLQSINGEYRAVPHKIVDGEIVLLVKSGGTFILSEEVVTFPDIAKLWNKDDVEFLASRHVIKGNSGTFAPNADITRAEFASMIARALGLQATEAVQFADTKGKWYEADVQALYEAGITTGVSVNAFNPNEKISRQQAAAFMARVLAYVDFKATATKSSSFKDADSINALYKQNIELLYSLDIMSGKEDGTFDAAGNLTRAQMAKILKRTLNTAGLM